MKIKTKALIHYIINSTVILITVGALVLFWSTNESMSKGWSASLPFLLILIISLLTYSISTLALANEQSSPFKMTLPVFISSMGMAVLGLLIVLPYISFFNGVDGSSWNAINPGHKTLMSIVMMFLAIPLAVIILLVNIYLTKFLLVSLSGDIASEWATKNFVSLIFTKSDIYHGEQFSYLYSEDRIIIMRFITEEQDMRVVVLEEDERNQKSLIITQLENEIIKLDELNINVLGSIIFLSNTLPRTLGNSDRIKLFKNNELFKKFKSIEECKKIDVKLIEEKIK